MFWNHFGFGISPFSFYNIFNSRVPKIFIFILADEYEYVLEKKILIGDWTSEYNLLDSRISKSLNDLR